MNTLIHPEKMTALMVLDILKEHSDENNPISTQKDIADLVYKKYDKKIDRHALKSDLMDLRALGYNIECKEATRKNKNGEEETVCSNWYLERDTTDAELSVLIDGLLFSKYIPYSQCKKLVEKLEGLSSKHFKARHKLPENYPENRQLFLTVETINEAILKNKQIAFKLTGFGPDLKERFVQRQNETEPHIYKVSPLDIVITNGRYYLICIHSERNMLLNFRIDYMRDIKLLDDKRRQIKDIPGYVRGWDLAKYMKEHIYMYGGGSSRVTFRADTRVNPYIGSHIIDWFGNDAAVIPKDNDDTITVSVTVNEQAMLYWALQYGQSVEILEPASLREKVQDTLRDMAKRYKII